MVRGTASDRTAALAMPDSRNKAGDVNRLSEPPWPKASFEIKVSDAIVRAETSSPWNAVCHLRQQKFIIFCRGRKAQDLRFYPGCLSRYGVNTLVAH